MSSSPQPQHHLAAARSNYATFRARHAMESSVQYEAATSHEGRGEGGPPGSQGPFCLQPSGSQAQGPAPWHGSHAPWSPDSASALHGGHDRSPPAQPHQQQQQQRQQQQQSWPDYTAGGPEQRQQASPPPPPQQLQRARQDDAPAYGAAAYPYHQSQEDTGRPGGSTTYQDAPGPPASAFPEYFSQHGAGPQGGEDYARAATLQQSPTADAPWHSHPPAAHQAPAPSQPPSAAPAPPAQQLQQQQQQAGSGGSPRHVPDPGFGERGPSLLPARQEGATELDYCRAVISHLERGQMELQRRVQALQDAVQQAGHKAAASDDMYKEQIKQVCEGDAGVTPPSTPPLSLLYYPMPRRLLHHAACLPCTPTVYPCVSMQVEAKAQQREQQLVLVQRHADAMGHELRSCQQELQRERDKAHMGRDEVVRLQEECRDLVKQLDAAHKKVGVVNTVVGAGLSRDGGGGHSIGEVARQSHQGQGAGGCQHRLQQFCMGCCLGGAPAGRELLASLSTSHLIQLALLLRDLRAFLPWLAGLINRRSTIKGRRTGGCRRRCSSCARSTRRCRRQWLGQGRTQRACGSAWQQQRWRRAGTSTRRRMHMPKAAMQPRRCSRSGPALQVRPAMGMAGKAGAACTSAAHLTVVHATEPHRQPGGIIPLICQHQWCQSTMLAVGSTATVHVLKL